MTSNLDLFSLKVKDMETFVTNIHADVADGETLLLDFIYFIHPVRPFFIFLPSVSFV